MFGKGFYREHGEKPGNLWVQAITRLNDTELAHGLVNLANDDLKFVPNLSQFVSACRRPVESRPWEALPAPVDPKVEAEKAWADMERLAGRKLR